jgi:signal transduction histidine kinase
MGVPSTPGQAAKRTAGKSINFYLGTRLIGPVIGLLVLWGLLAWAVLSGALGKLRWLATASPDDRAIVDTAVLTGAALLIVLVVVVLVGRFARRLSREVRELAGTADLLAGDRLPRAVEALRGGEQPAADVAWLPPPWPEPTVSEIATTATAVASMYRSAVGAAAAEAGLRSGFRHILVSLGRRNQSLLQRQLRIIDTLERQAPSPGALAELFTLDHLTTRMRRHAESLTILSGVASGRTWSGPVPVIDVMRAAAAEVEDYTRVTVISDSSEAVAAAAVTDMIHLLAELIENATLFSPSTTRVEVRAERVANGFAVEVEDRGLGIPAEQLAELNAKLASPPDFDLADADRLGLFVAGRLAARHGVYVSLAPSPYRGTKAIVVLPDSIMVLAPEIEGDHPERPLRDSGQLNLRAPEALSLVGAAYSRQADAAEPGTAPDPDPPADPQSGGEWPAPITRQTLPRRIRPGRDASVPTAQAGGASGSSEASGASGAPGAPGAPGSEEAGQPDRPAPRHAAVEAPAPEAARNLAASLQNSWQRSREEQDSESDRGEDRS